MLDFKYSMKTELFFGKDSVNLIADEIAKYGKKVMIVSYRKDFLSKLNLDEKLEVQLKEKGISYIFYFGVMPNPKVELVREGIQLARESDVDFLLAIGGGSAIDTAKSIALGVNYDGDIWDFTFSKPEHGEILPVGVVLTIPASGSEVSNGAILNNDELHLKRGFSYDGMLPKFAVMNPEFTYTLPKYNSACGIVDILSHVMERYFTSTPDVDLIDRISEGAMVSIIENGRKVMKNPRDYNARSQLMLAGSIGHNGLLGVGRERDWSSHYIEHEVSAFYNLAHGAGLAIITPNWMKYVYQYDVNRFAQFARQVMQVPESKDKKSMALEGIKCLEAFYRELEMPKTLTEVGIGSEHFEEIAKNTLESRPGVGSILKMNKEHIVNILNNCL